jgi:hypothetical protein
MGLLEAYIIGPNFHSLVLTNTRTTEPDGDGNYFILKEYNDGEYYTYGFVQGKDSYDHKAGYVWSSRPSCINAVFATSLIDVRLLEDGDTTGYGVAIPMARLKEILPDEFHLEEYYEKEDDNFRPRGYRIVNPDMGYGDTYYADTKTIKRYKGL